MSDEKIETFDEKNQVGILSGRHPTAPQGPRRQAPKYYVGETYGRHRIQYPDVERYPNRALPGARNKVARRMIRAALKRRFSSVEQALKLPRAMKAQAREVARDEKKSTRWARRLYDRELAIHQEVYVPSQKELRAMRTKARKDKRAGKQDVISQLVDKMSKR